MTATAHLHEITARWFARRFGHPTDPQERGWPEIARGRNVLIAAPTGSGKTLAAFLTCIDRLLRDGLAGRLSDATQVLYVSPLKALSNDVRKNLEIPLAEIVAEAEAAGHVVPPIRVAVRTGDTPASERAAMVKRPPHILVTTPESLYILLTSESGRRMMRTVSTVIVDEIHALARDKRGTHLTLSLERLEALAERPPVRIGLSATVRPVEEVARFLVGATRVVDGEPDCRILNVGHMRDLDLAVEVPPSELSAVCSKEQWAEVYEGMAARIREHRSTLVFVNTRRMAERVSHHLREILGEEAVASHHGSLSRTIRLAAEEKLKTGQLKAIVATASLELGIDIGFIDLVIQLGSPRSIATFLQRVGRSGHSLGATPKGRLLPLTRDELLEVLSLVRAVRSGRLDAIEIPEGSLDILAQQIVATVAGSEWDEDAMYDLVRRAWPYRDLTRDAYDGVLELLAEGIGGTRSRGAHLHRDRIGKKLRPRRGARIAATTSGGAIPEMADYRVVTEAERTYVGTVNEDFAIESMAGDIFLLGNTSWRVAYVRGGEVVVNDAHGAPATVPFWLGEAPGRTIELSHEVSRLRLDLASITLPRAEGGRTREEVIALLGREAGASEFAGQQAIKYVEAQVAAIGLVPTQDEIVFERFFDEAGGMQLVIHAPFGARINRAWGLALRKRFCRSFDFELQASADDNGILLSLSPQHSFPIEHMFRLLPSGQAHDLLVQALLAAPMFQTRWRWNITRALAVLRHQGGRKVPPPLQRFRADDLLAAVFPGQVACQENRPGDIEVPDHPLVQQTVYDCLHEAMDIDRWLSVLRRVEAGEIRLVARDTREPSPFSYQILNAYPYAFLDDAPLEERRARAVATRRTLAIDDVRDLARLDPDAIDRVRAEAWPLVRDADELHDALLALQVLPDHEAGPWSRWLADLAAAGRVTRLIPASAGLPHPAPRPAAGATPRVEPVEASTPSTATSPPHATRALSPASATTTQADPSAQAATSARDATSAQAAAGEHAASAQAATDAQATAFNRPATGAQATTGTQAAARARDAARAPATAGARNAASANAAPSARDAAAANASPGAEAAAGARDAAGTPAASSARIATGTLAASSARDAAAAKATSDAEATAGARDAAAARDAAGTPAASSARIATGTQAASSARDAAASKATSNAEATAGARDAAAARDAAGTQAASSARIATGTLAISSARDAAASKATSDAEATAGARDAAAARDAAGAQAASSARIATGTLATSSARDAAAAKATSDAEASAGARDAAGAAGAAVGFWVATERWPLVAPAYPGARMEPQVEPPPWRKAAPGAAEAWVALVRGRLEAKGPVTAAALMADLALTREPVESALGALEAEGFALRGEFTPPPVGSPARVRRSFEETEWCERRLLARIHRLTLEGLRKQIQPVEPAHFLQFLLEHQHIVAATAKGGGAPAGGGGELSNPAGASGGGPTVEVGSSGGGEAARGRRTGGMSRSAGREALLEVIEQLQGFEMPAGAWEHDVLPSRLAEYDQRWLDDLSMSGAVVWGRLQPPRRDVNEDAPVTSASPMTRVVPIALVVREDLPWLLPPDRQAVEGLVRANAQRVLDILKTRGALFPTELAMYAHLLPAQLDDALGELAALGAISSDGFAAVRGLVTPERKRIDDAKRRFARRSGHALRAMRPLARGGRWSRFPGDAVSEVDEEERITNWAHQLLARYGVVFRDLLARESVAPAWRLLLPVYRRLEARGEIRGGRFVAGVAGEQFASSETIDRLRRVRDGGLDETRTIVLSAAEPANLAGIITPGPRVPATRTNRLLIRAGRLVASLQGAKVVLHEDTAPAQAERLGDLLRRPAAR